MIENQEDHVTILVVDDSPDMRLALKFALERHGWIVIEAENGKQALACVQQQMPKLMILDNRMPVMTGEQTYRELVRKKIKIPVILITASIEISNLATKLNAKCYLGKPFKIESLLTLVNQALRNDCCHPPIVE